MTTQQKENVAKWRAAHHAALATIFGASDGLKLWRKLVKIESAAHSAAEKFCNGEIDEDAFDAAKLDASDAVADLSATGKAPEGFFVNGDPRGYALKIGSEEAKSYPGLHRDWGGYGCLAARIDG